MGRCRGHPEERPDAAQQQGGEHDLQEKAGFRRVDGRGAARQDVVDGVEAGRDEGDDGTWLEHALPRPDDDQHADEADRDREPAAPADPLAEEWD